MRTTLTSILVVVCLIHPVSASETPNAELARLTSRIADLIAEGDQDIDIHQPIAVDVRWDVLRPGAERDDVDRETLVPFTVSGPMSYVGEYVARFRSPGPPLFRTPRSGGERARAHHFELVDFKQIPWSFGHLDWTTATPSLHSVIIKTRRWGERDNRTNPTIPGRLEIDIGPEMSLRNLD